jgi:predicted ATPase/class 3 adenylate cyclase
VSDATRTDRSDHVVGRTLPTGTVTFLRTDIEGSMGLVRATRDRWDVLNATHLGLIREAVRQHGGVVVRTEGDAMFAAFQEAGAAAAASVDAQRAITAQPWPDDAPIRVRMGLHSGEAHMAGDDYGGFEVNRAARVAATGHGGQIVVSETTRALIVDELPSGTQLIDLGTHLLRDVPRPERLSQLTVDGLPSTFPPLRTGGAVRGDLPDRMTSFLGRDAEVATLVELAAESRLLTLTGPGGIGKTSLAVEVARTIAPRFPDGAWFVPLADVTDPADLDGAIARGIGLLDGPERTAASALVPYLADRSVVLVLDNLEHLLGAAESIATVARSSAASRVLVTSRAPLHVSGEQEVPVHPLSDDAVRLFVDRARAVQPGWEPGPDLPIVEEICRLLDDLPLGIELAAARVARLSPMVIRDRLAARLPLPGPGRRDAPARQQTLESAVAWSRDLLSPDRQALLDALAVFDGGFDLDQVNAVAGPPAAGSDRLDHLLDLADQSLIVPVPEAHGRVRFRLLRTIQSFGLDRLAADGREVDVRRRHAGAFLDLARTANPHFNSSRHAMWIDRLEPDQANFRSALRWAIDAGQGDLALRLVTALWRVWHGFGQVADGRVLAQQALAMAEAPRTGSDRAWAEAAAGSLAYWQADHDAAKRHYEAEIAVATEADDQAAIADGYFNLGHVLFLQQDEEQLQRAYTDDVIARFVALGDERGAARARWAFAIIAMGRERVDEAYGRLVADVAEFERLDDRQYHAMTIASIAWVAFVSGDIPTAARYAVESIVESQAMRDLGTTTISLHVGVLLGSMIGRFEDAARIRGAFEALCDRYGVRPPAALELFVGNLNPLEQTREVLGPEGYAAAYEAGRRMSLDEAVALIVELGDVVSAGGPAGPLPG